MAHPDGSRSAAFVHSERKTKKGRQFRCLAAGMGLLLNIISHT